MMTLPKLRSGDRVAIVSPSFAAPGKWPHVYELGLARIREVFGLQPVEFPTTRKIGASKEERAQDLIDAFCDPTIKAVIASLGGDDQVTYIKQLPREPFQSNPKPFFGYSDNTHFANHLWLLGIPSYYGGAVLTQFAMQGAMDEYTVRYLRHAFFTGGEVELVPSDSFSDIGLDWDDPKTLALHRPHEPNEGWVWDGTDDGEGVTWGGCLESIDELLRHGIPTPSLGDLEHSVLMTETSEELPSHDYVYRVYRALGERGILARVNGVLVGRPKAQEIGRTFESSERAAYRQGQQEVILRVVRTYNPSIPVVQNLDFGHTDPQIPMPYGRKVRIDSHERRIFAQF